MRNFIVVGCVFVFSSCATLLNPSSKEITVHTKQKSKVIINGLALVSNVDSTQFKTIVARGKNSVRLEVISGDVSKEISIPARNSFAYWINIYFNYGIGLLIDMENPKRYTYPRNIYIDLENEEIYYPFLPLSDEYYSKKNRVKLTPLKLVGALRPGIEFSYERMFSKQFSAQVMGAYLMKGIINYRYKGEGFSTALGGRYYFGVKRKARMYTSLEMGLIKRKSEIEWSFHEPDSVHNYYRDKFNVNSTQFYVVPKFGIQFVLSNRFVLDTYLGVGYKKDNVKHSNINNPNDVLASPRHPSIFYNIIQEGKRDGVKFLFNAKLGFVF